MLQLFNLGTQQRPARQVAPVADASPLRMKVEVKEDNKSLTFLASLAGFSKDDIKVILAFTCTANTADRFSLEYTVPCSEIL